ncbi:nuclear transport factor 2 family protein [Blastococcus sp. SYSU D00820]
MDDELTRELLELEHRGWEALRQGTGADFYGALMTADGVMVLADGTVADRAAVVAALENAPPWTRFELDSARAVPAGDGAAVLVYTARAWRGDDDPPFTAAMTSTYARGNDGWQLAVYTQTPLPAG